MKKIDLNKSIYEVVKENPEVVEILYDLGFTEIKKKAMLHSIGKLTSLPKGCKIRGIELDKVILALKDADYEIVGSASGDINKAEQEEEVKISNNLLKSDVERLKYYLKRLNNGEDIAKVRHDFAVEFKSVDPSVIMEAEQEIIREGTHVEEVQKLCDVHSALFHGDGDEMPLPDVATGSKIDKLKSAKMLEGVYGHPLYTFSKENQALESVIGQIRSVMKEKKECDELRDAFARLREVSTHYSKKGDLIYPHLSVKYGISGPSDIMWTVDDEIRDEIASLARKLEKGGNLENSWFEKLEEVLTRAEEMIYKEENILFPICSVNFTKDEWIRIYFDSKDYDDSFGVENGIWQEAEERERHSSLAMEDDMISLPGGYMNKEQLTAIMNTIPMEITFVDDNNINCFFNEGHKAFKRAKMAIGREVFSCHPPKIEAMVKAIIGDLREGKKDKVEVWMEKNGKNFLVAYHAVRDSENKYLGVLELVQDMEFAKKHFTEK